MKRFYIIGVFLLLIITIPITMWYTSPNHHMKMAIIDKTVPNETYREHLGISWLLNHLKFTREENKPYDTSLDYFGFFPNDKKKTYEIRELPTDYTNYDVIYLADTYGVYDEDFPWVKKIREGGRSSRIYGGLEENEWNAIMERLNQDKPSTLIAEYNTFASPTNDIVRKSVTDYLGLDWSGWVGRYFNELDPEKNQEIPRWILDEFKGKWNYSGEGFILVNDITYEVIVLENEKHIEEGGISLTFTAEGIERFNLKKSPDYQYWFDIVTPKEGTEVLANYEWSLTDEGKQLLAKHDIPSEFAAVLTNKLGASSSYYFAGDFNDIAEVPRFYQMKGLPTFYKIANAFSEDTFYWSTYIPLVESILRTKEEKRLSNNSSPSNQQLQYVSRVMEDSFEILKDNKWTPITIKGVNMGMGKPGYFPGEAAITEEEYYRWFQYISEMNANTIRVYTLHPPGFYNALKRYNENHEEKIYVFHGVWINEEKLADSLDAFEKENLEDFQYEMQKIVDVIHGNNIVKAEPGHSSGVYRADVSEYVIGWIIGIEWYPYMVENTNNMYASIGDYNGQYFYTKAAQPFENWLAQQMDYLVKYEVEKYNIIRPMSFTNWVTTDILTHPSEPDEKEDLVSVDPNVIYTKDEMDVPSQFASYHIYPYYPDFFNYEEKYLNFKDHRGENNSYAAYLSELHDAHRLPILVAEFGVPSSRGLTHDNAFGWTQGFLSEKEQGQITSRLFEDIMAEKLLGGLIFTWQDEWFKRTWNTMDFDNPERRPFWSNAQTNEQQFGLLSFDVNKIQVDGKTNDWEGDTPLYQKQDSVIRSMYVDHDERYLYIRVDTTNKEKGFPMILLDVVPNQGNHFISGNNQISFENGIDFLINLRKEESRILVDDYYDINTYLYAYQLKMIQSEKPFPQKNSGRFSNIQYALNRELSIPTINKTIPFQLYETGKLIEGNGNPKSKDYNSLADYYIDKSGLLEIRIPWLLIQAKDPSQREFFGDVFSDGMGASTFINEINVGVLYLNEEGEVVDSFPEIENRELLAMKGYEWEKWDLPNNKERLKQSYYYVRDLFKNY